MKPDLPDELPADTVSVGVKKDVTPKVMKASSVQERLLEHPVGWIGERPRSSPWTTQKLSKLDQTSGYVGSMTIITAREEDG